MLPLAKAFLDIALLRRGPQDLPASPLLLYLSLAAVLVTYIVAISPLHPPPNSLARAFVDIFVYHLVASRGPSIRGRKAVPFLRRDDLK